MNELIRQWLIAVLGYSAQNVIRANQEGPIPSGNFATYRLLFGETSDFSIESSVGSGNDLVVTYYNKGTYTFQVDIYDPDGMTLQHELSQSGYLLSVREILQPSYVAMAGSGGIQDLTELIDTKHKIRYQCDHKFRLWNTITEGGSKVSNGYEITGKYQPDDEIVEIIVP